MTLFCSNKNPKCSKNNYKVDILFIPHVSHWLLVRDRGSVCCLCSQTNRAATIWNVAGHEQSGAKDLWMAAHLQLSEPAQ